MNVYCPLGTFCKVALNRRMLFWDALTLIVYAPKEAEDEGISQTIGGILGVAIDTFVIESSSVTTVMRVCGIDGIVIIRRTATATIANA
jgi:hypothetical protein